MRTSEQSLTNLQLELLKLFTFNVNERDLKEIKKLLSNYFAKKATSSADKAWNEKGWSDKDVEKLLNSHLRTPYKS